MNENDINCYFGKSSDRLMVIAKYTQPTSNPTTTLFRHIMSFNMYENRDDFKVAKDRFDDPLSFYIEGVGDFAEEALISLIRHINFHMLYHDSETPTIHIHDPELHDESEKLPIRYIEGQFPTFIHTNLLDENILSYWEGALRSNEFLKFIIFYRIIEYIAVQYSDHKTRSKFSLIIQRPSLLSNIAKSIDEIVEISRELADKNLREIPRITSMLDEFVDCKKLWTGIEGFKDELSENISLDGGFNIPRLISKDDDLNNFEPKGVSNFFQQARKIRNALSHGKDIGSEGIISPTKRNLKLLEPWVELMRIVAGEVVVYHSRH